MKIWEADQNAKGGLLGRPVKLVYYDDQTARRTCRASTPSCSRSTRSTLILGPYSTIMNAPLMPIAMAHNMVLVSLPRWASTRSSTIRNISRRSRPGPIPPSCSRAASSTRRAAQNPKPQTVALASSRPGILAQRLRRRARQRQDARHQDRLRQILSADHDRFLADRARDPGDQPRHPLHRVLSAGFGGHAEIHQRDRLQAQDDRRLDGGVEQPPPSRCSSARCLNGIVGYENWLPLKPLLFPGVEEHAEEVPGAGAGRRRRSAGLQHRDLGLRLSPGPCRGRRRREKPRPGQDRPVAPPQRAPYRAGQLPLRRPTASGPVRASSPCSTATSPARRSTSSATPTASRSSIRRNTRPAT